MKREERIKRVMENLAKYFDYQERTTLNRMRKKPEAFKILISCLLSLRTQDKNTEKASKKLFAVADAPQKILKLPDKKLEELIFSSGHYKKKARTLKQRSFWKSMAEEFQTPEKNFFK
jgi:endonuclease-3